MTFNFHTQRINKDTVAVRDAGNYGVFPNGMILTVTKRREELGEGCYTIHYSDSCKINYSRDFLSQAYLVGIKELAQQNEYTTTKYRVPDLR